ncbi:MAG: hypothetical protein ACOX21_08280 [Bacillota bacterium]|jgi:hypothetical protein|nr:hypothetical protein [Bacillota bacterium]HOC06199.1 hypothetical protein [Bacillota bacterium]HPZ22072.1 hypothetical protein [Bacillota bacterium]HQD19866.1 hypothetical protein [Bacillota bacterium]
MRRIGISLLIALCLTALAALLDRFVFAESFGLWTFTLGTLAGLVLIGLGLVLFIFRLLTAKKIGASPVLILSGIVAFLLSLAVWIATGRPAL